MTKLEAKIAAIENTLKNDADVLSPAQVSALHTTIAKLRGLVSAEQTFIADRAVRVAATDAVIAEMVATDDQTVGNLASRVAAKIIDIQATRVETVAAVEPVNNVTREFVTAGKAIFTFESVTGERFTFKVTRPDRFRGEYFGAVMKGTDNENDYKYVGMVNGSTFALRATNGSRQFGADSKEFKVLATALRIVATGKALPAGYKLLHSGKCGRCARTLTTPESIERGIGPECANILSAAA